SMAWWSLPEVQETSRVLMTEVKNITKANVILTCLWSRAMPVILSLTLSVSQLHVVGALIVVLSAALVA
ncbi:MAG: hypothetical protein JAY60_20695, partial [Candidatus Thiodiazotropha weberae]|nr:hypothetical protein [Candidatus Thiodiazotropha weberae]